MINIFCLSHRKLTFGWGGGVTGKRENARMGSIISFSFLTVYTSDTNEESLTSREFPPGCLTLSITMQYRVTYRFAQFTTSGAIGTCSGVSIISSTQVRDSKDPSPPPPPPKPTPTLTPAHNHKYRNKLETGYT